jgi:cysteine desulfurase/selenocysteine lyase
MLAIAPATASPLADHRGDFPGLTPGWHYLDSAVSAQKPQVVIDAMVRAMGVDYASVHRGVYARSANMTLAFEAARRRTAAFIGAAEDEIVFVRGATEGINLIAQTHPDKGRILLSVLEHHSNIVPWQLAGWQVDVCPLTADGCIDLDAAAAMLTPAHKMVALAHVSNVLGSTLDVARAAELAHRFGAELLIDGCQAVPRLPVDVAALGCDHYVFSGHKLYGPTGIGVLWSRRLADLPPWQGGGSMIDRVRFDGTSYAPAPLRFEAGTPAIVEAIALHAAMEYVAAIGLDAIHAHEQALVQQTREALRRMGAITLHGPEDGAGIVSFSMEGVHPHDIGTILDEGGVAIRAGHHCAQPLMAHLGVPATARASFGLYSHADDVGALVDGLHRVKRIFG